MRKRRIPIEITQWIALFLSNRITRMRFNGINTDLISTSTGIPQGSPLSPILYILYNSDLLDISKEEKQLGLGYIDDILYGVQNKTAMGNIRELKRLLDRSEKWRQQFEKSKYVLIIRDVNNPQCQQLSTMPTIRDANNNPRCQP